MEDIRIEKLDTGDAGLLSKVALHSYSDHYLHLWHDEGKWYKEKFFSTERLTEEMTDSNSQFYLAYYHDEAVGFLKLNINAPLEGFETKNALELERIYLNKEVTGKGIGRKLVQLAVNTAKQNHKNIVWLKAMDTSKGSMAFYEKMGFRIKGTYRLKHHMMKEELRGMVIMVKEL